MRTRNRLKLGVILLSGLIFTVSCEKSEMIDEAIQEGWNKSCSGCFFNG